MTSRRPHSLALLSRPWSLGSAATRGRSRTDRCHGPGFVPLPPYLASNGSLNRGIVTVLAPATNYITKLELWGTRHSRWRRTGMGALRQCWGRDAVFGCDFGLSAGTRIYGGGSDVKNDMSIPASRALSSHRHVVRRGFGEIGLARSDIIGV
jgi:hypothetical protein